MKRFLTNFMAWAAVLFVLTFFLAGWVFAQGHWYRPVLVLALLLSGFTCALLEQADEIAALRKRLDALEKGQAGPSKEGTSAAKPAETKKTRSDQEE